MQERVGLVGVGIIGSAIAGQLTAAGVPLTVYDVRSDALNAFPDEDVAPSVADVARVVDVLLVAVQTDEQCHTVVAEALEACAPGTVIVVHATVLPSTVEALARAAAAHDVELLDAPVAGSGEEGIRNQSMWVLAGGDAATIDRVRPVFQHYSGRVLHTGAVGSGTALKLSHNLFVYLGYQAVREAVEFARAAGVADGLLAEVTTASEMMSPQFRVYHDIYERRRALPAGAADPDGGVFSTYAAVLDKDVHHALALAADNGIELPGAETLRGTGTTVYRADL